MFSHVMVGANDVAASKKFYDAVLGAIGVAEGKADPKGRIFYRTKFGVFGITKPIDGKVATHANGGTVGFTCDSPEKVKAFHDAGVASGGKSIEDPPGWREGAFGKLYLAYQRRILSAQDLRATTAVRCADAWDHTRTHAPRQTLRGNN
jgi:catechol 2,3-dioxygenase-like lactoylglutathione lyase family enzyme